MKVGIDSYCYHRFFGDVYPEQKDPGRRITLEDFLKRAKELGVDGVSLESCFVPRTDKDYLAGVKGTLDEYGMDRVWAWGHPDGLEGGKNEAEFEKMLENFEYAKAIGADVMRVVGSSLMFRNEPHHEQIERLSKMFCDAVKIAEKYDIKMAIENHIDFNSEEILQILNNVNSPYMGVNFDTGNFIRVLDDPVKAAEKLGQYTFATHVKDVKLLEEVTPDTWYFFACAEVGKGLVDVKGVAAALKNAGYEGCLALEMDFLHPEFGDDWEPVIERSIAELKKVAASV
jgi:sugar phosphate isomerase/epimerase